MCFCYFSKLTIPPSGSLLKISMTRSKSGCPSGNHNLYKTIVSPPSHYSNLDYYNSEDFTINPWWLRSKTSVGDSKNPFLLKLVWKVYFLRSLIKPWLCFINKRNGNTSFWDSNPTFPWSGRSFSNPVSDF